MKSLYSIFFFSMFISFCFSQEKEGYENSALASPSSTVEPPPPKSKMDDNAIFDKVEVEAEFPKGNISSYISQYIKYTEEARLNKIEGRILIKFVVEKDGTVSGVRVASKKLGYGLDEMAINAVMKTSGLWKPATIDGNPVRTNFILPVTFRQLLEDPEPTDTPE